MVKKPLDVRCDGPKRFDQFLLIKKIVKPVFIWLVSFVAIEFPLCIQISSWLWSYTKTHIYVLSIYNSTIETRHP